MKKKLLVIATMVLLALQTGLRLEAALALRSDILYMLPRESGEVGFLDLQALRASPHYRLIKQRMVPSRFGHMERFLRTMGVDVDEDLDWLAWVLVPPGPDQPGEMFLGIAQGQFFPENVEEYYLQQDLPLDAYRGQTLFPVQGEGAKGLLFTFLDSSTAAFGPRRGLELLVETRFGGHESLLRNETLVDRLNEVNGNSPVWAVLNEHYTRLAVRQLLPEVAKFDQFSQVAKRLRFSSLQLQLDRAASLDFRAWCAEPADAQTFSFLLQTGLLAQSWALRESNPTLSSVLDQADVRTAGTRLAIEVPIEESNLRALLERSRLR